jgi:hypothetical protein
MSTHFETEGVQQHEASTIQIKVTGANLSTPNYQHKASSNIAKCIMIASIKIIQGLTLETCEWTHILLL